MGVVANAVVAVASIADASVSAPIEGEGAIDVVVVVAVVVCVEEEVVKEDGDGDVREDDAKDDCG